MGWVGVCGGRGVVSVDGLGWSVGGQGLGLTRHGLTVSILGALATGISSPAPVTAGAAAASCLGSGSGSGALRLVVLVGG